MYSFACASLYTINYQLIRGFEPIQQNYTKLGAHDWTRTSNTRIFNLLLYQLELRGHKYFTMQYYKTLDIPSLADIQTSVLSVLPNEHLTNDSLRYVYDDPATSTKFFLGIPVLKELIDSYKLTHHLAGICIINKSSNSTTDIHIDRGSYKLSLNIPIIGCEGTYTHFYKTNHPPELVEMGVNKFWRLKAAHCRKMDTLDTSKPAVLDTSVPHCVENYTSNTRIMLLIRLKGYINFDWFE